MNLDLLALPSDAGVKFSGYLNVPADGTYTFWLTDDDGAQLWLHEAHVIDDDFNHSSAAVSGSINLKAGLHPFRLFYRHGESAPTLKLEFEGPGITRQVIPASYFAASAEPSTSP